MSATPFRLFALEVTDMEGQYFGIRVYWTWVRDTKGAEKWVLPSTFQYTFGIWKKFCWLNTIKTFLCASTALEFVIHTGFGGRIFILFYLFLWSEGEQIKRFCFYYAIWQTLWTIPMLPASGFQRIESNTRLYTRTRGRNPSIYADELIESLFISRFDSCTGPPGMWLMA